MILPLKEIVKTGKTSSAGDGLRTFHASSLCLCQGRFLNARNNSLWAHIWAHQLGSPLILTIQSLAKANLTYFVGLEKKILRDVGRKQGRDDKGKGGRKSSVVCPSVMWML